MASVFTNDEFYLSARNDLLAVTSTLFRKQQTTVQPKLRTSSSARSGIDWMGISELWCMCSTIQYQK
jgi:hypothetical protein